MPSLRNCIVHSHGNKRRDTKFLVDVHTFDCLGIHVYVWCLYGGKHQHAPTGLSAFMLGKLGLSSKSVSPSPSTESLNKSFVCLLHNKTTAREWEDRCVKHRFPPTTRAIATGVSTKWAFPQVTTTTGDKWEAYQACAVTAACFHDYTDTPLSGNSKLQIFTKTTVFCRTPTHRQYFTKLYVRSLNHQQAHTKA